MASTETSTETPDTKEKRKHSQVSSVSSVSDAGDSQLKITADITEENEELEHTNSKEIGNFKNKAKDQQEPCRMAKQHK